MKVFLALTGSISKLLSIPFSVLDHIYLFIYLIYDHFVIMCLLLLMLLQISCCRCLCTFHVIETRTP